MRLDYQVKHMCECQAICEKPYCVIVPWPRIYFAELIRQFDIDILYNLRQAMSIVKISEQKYVEREASVDNAYEYFALAFYLSQWSAV